MMVARILKEPIIHFALIAALILGSYSFFETGAPNTQDRILVTSDRIEQLASVFAKTWQRPPSEIELKKLIDEYVKDEIYAREAVKLGLDQDDTVIRRRLRQKMEFLNEAAAGQLAPTDAELSSYLAENQSKFAIDPAISFEQVFINPERHGSRLDAEVARLLELLTSHPATDVATLGDPTMLPAEVTLSSRSIVAQAFGPDFAEAVVKLEPGHWSGPLKSGFGYHIVRLTGHEPGRAPLLAEVRDAASREWKEAKRQQLEDARLADLLKRYDVRIDIKKQAEAP